VTDAEPTTQDEASIARNALIEALTLDWIFGFPSGFTDGQRWFRSIGVRADAPDYKDHYIHIILPSAVDVSKIPSEFNGVRVVVQHENLPWIATS
jgi:hypothetical protein